MNERVIMAIGKAASMTVEYVILMEVLWPLVFPGRTFHEDALEAAQTLHARACRRLDVWRTLNVIRTLPETQREERE